MMRVFRLTRVGFAIALAYWCVDSCVDAFIFREGTLIDQLLAPTPAEIWVRLAFGLAVLCASTYAQYTIDISFKSSVVRNAFNLRSTAQTKGFGIGIFRPVRW
ncbi:MAG TPA: hypothetical protein EYO39_05515 [Nitrospirales bacterium]|nr:hypothetical protein [Nitrospirales bacterium]